ncbi:hypothetical protein PR048_018446 [Dryococelus australis]|uniref:Uncharacterized protein n=1 Tax=Dryococelus australis TaxID=614101 RepID=A0ABQ9HCG9_9NEOP|nr:hypothetical protein PR048_018446 [Dryococelus australis]
MKGRGKRETPRKPADQWHRPARFPHAKIRGRPRWESSPFRISGRQANRVPVLAESLPGFRVWQSCPDDAAGSQVFLSRISRFPPLLHSGRCFILASLSPSSALKSSNFPFLPKEFPFFPEKERRIWDSKPGELDSGEADLNFGTHNGMHSATSPQQETPLTSDPRHDDVPPSVEAGAALGSPLVDDRPIMNAVKYRVVSGVVWTNRTMASSNTDTNRTSVLAVVDIGDSLLTCLEFHPDSRTKRRGGVATVVSATGRQPVQISSGRRMSLLNGPGHRFRVFLGADRHRRDAHTHSPLARSLLFPSRDGSRPVPCGATSQSSVYRRRHRRLFTLWPLPRRGPSSALPQRSTRATESQQVMPSIPSAASLDTDSTDDYYGAVNAKDGINAVQSDKTGGEDYYEDCTNDDYDDNDGTEDDGEFLDALTHLCTAFATANVMKQAEDAENTTYFPKTRTNS